MAQSLPYVWLVGLIQINQGGASMHSLVFVLSIVGFGLEVAAFLLTVAVL
jgi:hypothetical protein